jgi:cation diffusion facilitator CzcD-associated flavoprotein CzcO
VGHTRVAIIGAGFSGIGMAGRLLKDGIDDFVVYERADEVGGTWRDNTYPGCQCDIPSVLYSFSFMPNPDWSRAYPLQAEIRDYLRRCATELGVMPHIRFGVEGTGASWDDEARVWRLQTSEGEHTANVLVGGMGGLTEPAYPEIDGLDSFEGTLFHSSRWEHDHDLEGERVAVIGTGASSIQFVPEIQPRVGKLTLFQRAPAWVQPDPQPPRGDPARTH